MLNSLLYWLLDMVYKEMARGEQIPKWAPEPFLLRRPGVEERMMAELAQLGHLLQLLALSPAEERPDQPLQGVELLRAVREMETTVTLLSTNPNPNPVPNPNPSPSPNPNQVTLLSTLRAQSEGREESEKLTLVAKYQRLIMSEELTLLQMRKLQYEALGELLNVEYDIVASRGASVRKALAEWRNPELLFRYLDDNRSNAKMRELITRWLRSIFGLSDETLRQIRRESHPNVVHLCQLPQDVLLRWFSEKCPGTSKCSTLFMLGEDAGSCLRIVSSKNGNRYNCALMGYVLQSHVRALVVFDTAGRVLARSLIRLLLRSDTLTPVIFCDPIFFTTDYSEELQLDVLKQARALELWMQVPIVHACSVLPVMKDAGHQGATEMIDGTQLQSDGSSNGSNIHKGGYVRRVEKLGYDITWVELWEMDGVAPYTYSEELPYDNLLDQHRSGVLERTEQCPVLTVAALPRADSPSAERYVKEREGQTAWTMQGTIVPSEILAQVEVGEHVDYQFNPNARMEDVPLVNRDKPQLAPAWLDA